MSEGTSIDTRTFTFSAQRPRDDAAGTRVHRVKAAIAVANRVIVATDPDREGESIAAEVWGWIAPGKAWRARFEEITLNGVRRGLEDMQPALRTTTVEAARARRVVDRLAGWHGTALVFDKLRQHRGLSAGRLQSAALRLVVERHAEREQFRPRTSFVVHVALRTAPGTEIPATLVNSEGTLISFGTETEARAITMPTCLTVASVETHRIEERPRPPFEASSWLQVASKTLGLSVEEATEGTQALFETGQTTYPRTDAVRVSDEAIAWARGEIARRFGRQYVPDAPWHHKAGRSAPVQGAHEAIRPTIPDGAGGNLGSRRAGRWGEAYALIERRFLASQAAARVVERTVASIAGGEIRLIARGQVERFDGWRRVALTDAAEESDAAQSDPGPEDDRDTPTQLPPLVQGQQLEVVRIDVVAQVTKPKPLFTQAGLIAELKRLGIGRPSTYQSVVPLLLSRGWVHEVAPEARRSRSRTRALPSLVPTPAGQDLCAFLIAALPSLVDYGFTASMEAALDDIEQGAKRPFEVAAAWWAHFHQELATAKSRPSEMPERRDLGPCPKCAAEARSGRLRLIRGVNRDNQRPYEFAGCDADTNGHRVCGHTAQVRDGQLLVARTCATCGAPLRAVSRKDGGRSWVCDEHGWFLAGRTWELVVAPPCPKCTNAMVHRERRDPKGEFFWACFSDGVFFATDRFGTVRKAPRGGSADSR
jgi:DNA topoisomerase I